MANDLKRLRGVVAKASQKPWVPTIRRHTMGNLGVTLDQWHASGPDVSEKKAKCDAEYMLEFSPSQVTALLDEIERLRKRLLMIH